MSYLYTANLDVFDRSEQLEIMLDNGDSAILRRGHYYDLSVNELARARRYVTMTFVATAPDEEPIGVRYLPVKGNPTNGQIPVFDTSEGDFVPSTVSGVSGGPYASVASVAAKADQSALDSVGTSVATVQAGLDLKVTDYVGLNRLGGADTATILNQAGADASALAVANGHRCVNLIIPRGDYKILSRIEYRNRVRWKFDEPRIFAGADMPAGGFPHGMFRTNTPSGAPFSAVAQGTADTVINDYVLRNVSLPALWDDSMQVTGAGIPALANVLFVDVAKGYIVIDKPCTATATGVPITRAATWFGQFNNCGIVGKGSLDPNGFAVGFITWSSWTRGFRFGDIELIHNRKADGSDAAWALAAIQGIDTVIEPHRVTGGRAVWEDGDHVSGTRVQVHSATSESGDDALAIGDEATSPGIAATQRPSREITAAIMNVDSARGYAVKIYTVGAVGGISGVKVVVRGRTGVYRSGGVFIVNDATAAPGSNRLRDISIEGELEVGSTAFDGSKGNNSNGSVAATATDGPCLYAQNADNVYFNVGLKLDQPLTPPAVRKIYSANGCDNLQFGPKCGNLEVVRGSYQLTDFNNCPRLNIEALTQAGNLSRHASSVEFKDDFVGRSLDLTKWTVNLGTPGGPTVALGTTLARGHLLMTTGNNAGASMAVNGAQITGGLDWQRAHGVQAQGLSLETIVNLAGASLIHVAFLGFTDQNTALEMPVTLAGGTPTALATDAIGFLFDSAATNPNWYGIVVVAGVVQVLDLGVITSWAVSGFDRLSLYAQTNGNVTWYVNGVKRGVTTGGNPTVLLAPYAGVFAHGSAVRFLDVDLFRCEMKRAS